MFEVTADSRHFRVCFQKKQATILRSDCAVEVPAVCCSIFDVTYGRAETPSMLGESYCSPLDRFDRRAGKRLALQRALIGLERAERRAFWEAWTSSPDFVVTKPPKRRTR